MKRYKLKEICIRITDGAHYSPIGVSQGIPMLSVKDMEENKFNYSNCKYISKDDYEDLVRNDCKPLENDVLIAKDGSYLKHVFVIKEEIDQAILSSIGILRPNSYLINPYYLKYYLQTKSIKETVAKKYVSGSALPRIILKNFGEIEIWLPDLPTQQKIAAVLSALDDKIELNNKINAELEAMAKTLYDYWFVQFEFPNKEGKPYKSSGGKMVYNPILKREIPVGWEVKRLKDIAHIIMGQSPKGESYNEENKGILLINGAADYEGNYLKPRIFTSSPTRLCNKGDLVFCIRATIGKLTYAEDVYCLGRGVAAVRANEVEFTEYIFYSLNQEIERFKKHASGSIIVGITKDDLTDYFVLIPPIEILVKIHDNLKPIHSKIRLNLKQNQELAQLRDWLLPMLMNGQVKVEDVEKEEVNKAAEASIKFKHTRHNHSDDAKFEHWLQHQGLAARGDIDKDTLREIFDAMDDEDK